MDILIAVVAGVAQFVAALLGWRVSTKPPRSKKQQYLYEVIFIAAGLFGVGAVITSEWKRSIDQAESRVELRQVTGADNFVFLRPDLNRATERGYQLFTDGVGGIAGGVFNIVPATAIDANHPDYGKGQGQQFLALHSGMATNAFLPAGSWRIEFVSLTTGHYNEFVDIGEINGKPVIKSLRVVRGNKQIYPEEK